VDEEIAMKQSIRSKVVLAAVFAVAGTMCFAESGAAIYKASCQACHGSTGTPSPGIAKMMGVKPASEYKSSEKEMMEAVKNGKGKMKAFSGKLNDAQIKDAVTYFRSLK
jgi:cytochrome c6